jgi:chemotaxis protein methyltransferase CheR
MTPEMHTFLGAVEAHSGIDYRGFDDAWLDARLGALVAAGVEPGDERVHMALVPHATPLFASPELFRALRVHAIPFLRTFPSVRVWVPACGTGELAYAVAILLREEGLGRRGTVYATCVHPAVLARARRAAYDADTLDLPGYARAEGRATIAEYVRVGEGRVHVRPVLRDRIVFGEHNVTTDASPNEFHLIVSANVLGRLGPALRARVLRLYGASLCRFGLLAGEPEVGAGYTPVVADQLWRQTSEEDRR